MSIESLLKQLASDRPQSVGYAAGRAGSAGSAGSAQNQASALNQSLQGTAQACAQQPQYNALMKGTAADRIPPSAHMEHNWSYDPEAQRADQMKAALVLMNRAALEKYQPVIQLMGICVFAAPHWAMEITVNGRRVRHIWETKDADGGDLPEWDANFGYLLDRVARIKHRVSAGNAVAEENEILPISNGASTPVGPHPTGRT